MVNAFQNCYSLKYINLTKLKKDQIELVNNLFENCYSLNFSFKLVDEFQNMLNKLLFLNKYKFIQIKYK